jgi:glycosyltransferase involved in cell wall biosynthesis
VAATSFTVAQLLESDGPGGAEVVVFQLAQELRARGHTVIHVGPANGVGWLGERFRAAGFATETYVEGRPPDLRLIRHLSQVLRRRRVDIAHSHEFTCSVYGAAAARWIGVPHVISMHGHATMTQAWRRRAAVRWAFRNSAVKVAVSHSTKRQLDLDLGLRPELLGVVHNGIPVRRGDPEPVRRELGVREGESLILAVGNLDERKGHIFLLQALAQLTAGGSPVPWRLVIAGGRGGPERARLDAFAAEHDLRDRVHILGQREDIPNLQAAADVFAMPSLWEGLPIALLEAMHAGTAIVASEVSGIPEAIVSGEHGVLVPPGDSRALASALAELLASPAQRARLAAAARVRAEREFSVQAMADRYEALYRAACSAPSSRSRSSPA